MSDRACPPSPQVINFGCRLNALEAESVRALAAEAGHGDAVIVNTCAVTAEAVRQARQAIRKARRENPAARIVATGCAAQTDPASFAAMAEVDVVAGNADKLRPSFWQGLDRAPRLAVSDIMAVRETAGHLLDGFASGDGFASADDSTDSNGRDGFAGRDGLAGRARAFVEVQNGCDHRCTFCIIPFGRGPSRSVPMGAVIDSVRRIVDGGHNEVVLTGVDLTSYGGDLPGRPRLGDLVGRILKHVPDLPRLRLSSIDSIEVDEALLEVIQSESRLMPHLHLSLQAGDDMILKRMKRRHLRADAVEFCARVRQARPDIVLGADLIAGFPTETEAMFERTRDVIGDCGLTHVHVFPFSARQGTPAARMPQLPRPVVKERAAVLRAEGAAALAATLARAVGGAADLLVEKDNQGRTAHYLPARWDGAPVEAGAVVAGRVRGVADGVLTLGAAA